MHIVFVQKAMFQKYGVSCRDLALISTDEYLIVKGGSLAGTGAHSYSKGNATGGSDEAARFKES